MARKTKDESQQTRERILDAAEQEMLACGVGGASLERIARRANLTRGAIYWHFEDKSRLLEAMVDRTNMPLRELRRCLSADIPEAKPLALLREMMLHGVERLAQDEQHRRVCHIVLHRCEIDTREVAASRLLDAMFDDTRSVLISLCHEIRDQEVVACPLSPEDTCDVIVAYMAGLYECSLRHPDTYRVEHQARAKIDALLSGLFPEHAA